MDRHGRRIFPLNMTENERQKIYELRSVFRVESGTEAIKSAIDDCLDRYVEGHKFETVNRAVFPRKIINSTARPKMQ